MARLKKEDVTQLAEPIIIDAGILGDNEYKVDKITTNILDEVNKLAPKDMPKEQIPMDTPVKQLALLLGISSEEIKDVDLRIIGKVLNFIMGEVNAGLDTIKK